jgi:DNA end-binding protein Ku
MRNIWEGAISFGLIHIPVRLYSASKERTPKFQYLRKSDLCPIGYIKVCKSTGDQVPWQNIVKGYEYQDGDYVILSDEDFKRADPEKTQVIAIEDFVDQEDIDPKYFVKPYYVGPQKTADKVYTLLLEALKKTKKVGIGKFVMRTKEELVAVVAEKDMLMVNVLRFPEDLKKPVPEVHPKKTPVSAKELHMAIELIDKLSAPFSPGKYHDTYTDELEKVIKAKQKGKTFHIKSKKAHAPTKVPDLMATLLKSLHTARKKEHANA